MTSRLAWVARRLLGRENPPGGADTDRQLLERFVRDRDEAAFAALLERHGPMVRGVCRRVLGRSADADDAFQATFLVLVRRAAGGGWHESLGGWLHAVAHRVAHKARANASRAADRAARTPSPEEAAVTDADPPTAAAHRELCAVLDAELARLPEKYRLPLVLCYLEGRTNEEAAAHLGWTKGTVSGRLARARDLLRGRLARRGLAVSVAVLEGALGEMASAATPPVALFESTLKAAAIAASGPAALTGVVSAGSVVLIEGVSQAMFLTRLKVATAAVLAFALLGTGATLVAFRAVAGQKDPKEAKVEPGTAPADKPVVPTTDEEKLQGTWTVTNPESLQQGTQWTFNGGRLDGYSQPDRGTITSYKLDPEQKPRGLDLTVQSGTDGPIVFQVKGIYQLDGDELKICIAPGGEGRPKAFPVGAAAGVLVFKREPPARVTFLDKRGGKPPMQFYFVTLELANPRDRPVWLVTRYSGDQPLTESGKFVERQDGKPQMFGGDGYSGKTGGKGAAVRVGYIGNFRAFHLAPKTTVRFDRYEIPCWKDVELFEVWEVSSVLVNGRTALDKWLPYPTRSEGDVVIPAQTTPTDLDWDPKTAQSRKGYPNERIEFVKAEVIKKWLLPVAKLDAEAQAVAAVERLGGQVVRDERLPGKPVYSVTLLGKEVTDAALKDLAPFKGLTSLSLGGTEITAAGLKDLAPFKRLTFLSLTGAKVTDAELKELARLPGLIYLNLGSTKITDAGIRELAQLEGLKTLVLAETGTTDAGVRELARLKGLTTLVLAETGVTDAGLKELAPLKRLISLNLRGARVTDGGLKDLARHNSGLTHLNLASAAITDAGLKDLVPLAGLTDLDLSGTRVTDAGVEDLARLKGLSVLRLNDTGVTGAGLKALARHQDLIYLHLGGTRVTDAGVEDLAHLKGLTLLDLSGTKVTDAGAKGLAGLAKLHSLYLTDTGVTEAGVTELRRALPKCQITR